ncbi:bile acid:Na+ symporter, BASS family [Ekhidna lutea]|uniref:Bile acid:Na+ symporter, BASS family n=1 Tax=Ekhidna lutea TaxID=447679 RepID=A0A239I059_EKHLU|nr:bile acid:sodium symporter family protein [Ekhidna lutea]SNS86871.1 bile acid:Na+ symporter, BASS family [Ekhidna lutea]
MTNLSDVLVPAAIAIIMFGIGLNLTLDSFRRVFIRPKAILTGLSLQMIMLPAIGLLIASVWKLDPSYKVGIVLIAACPGGTASNLVTHMLQGRTALSISLTSFNSFLILFTIPFFTTLSLELFTGQHQEVALSFFDTFKNIGSTVIVPVITGLFIRHYFKSLADRIRPYLKYILPAILLIVFLVVGLNAQAGEGLIWDKLIHVLIPLLLLNITTILIGYWVAGEFKINQDGRYTISIEMGLQNSALAIFIASNILNNQAIAMVAIVYSSFSFFTTLGLAYLLSKKNR